MLRIETCGSSYACGVSQRVHDPKVLRAISHPVRNRILNELAASGSLRAADIARDLHIPANQASFHLRQLAKYGLVEEDPEAARDKRDRVWRAASDSLHIDIHDIEAAAGGKAAARVFMNNAASWSHLVVDTAYDVDDRPGGIHRSTSEEAIRLTSDEAKALRAEIEALAQAWKLRTRGRDDDRTTYLLHSMLLPYPEVPGETADRTPGEA